jgi:hypothetical protein
MAEQHFVDSSTNFTQLDARLAQDPFPTINHTSTEGEPVDNEYVRQQTSMDSDSPPPQPKLDMGDIKSFDGKKSNYRTFMRQLLLRFASNRKYFDSKYNSDADGNRIRLALSYMTEGRAGQFADNYFDNVGEKENYGTWDSFKKALDAIFHDDNMVHTAQRSLETWQQRGVSALEYFVHFETLAARAGYNPETHESLLVRLLQRGLNHKIVATLRSSENPPQTYEGWKERAVNLDHVWRQFEEDDRQEKFYRGPHSTPHSNIPRNPNTTHSLKKSSPTSSDNHPTLSSGAGAPMEIDRSQSRSTRNCYNCGKPGHLARDCPEPRKPPTTFYNRRLETPRISELEGALALAQDREEALKKELDALKTEVTEMKNKSF